MQKEVNGEGKWEEKRRPPDEEHTGVWYRLKRRGKEGFVAQQNQSPYQWTQEAAEVSRF